MSERIGIRFVRLRDGAAPPHRATPGASGWDLFACLPEPGFLDIGADPVRVPTGIAVEAPYGCDVQIRPRSGLAAQGVLSTFGTLDADYRGEIFATMYTVGHRSPHRVQHGDRIAQLVVSRVVAVAWQEVEQLSATARGAGGHGSTGR